MYFNLVLLYPNKKLLNRHSLKMATFLHLPESTEKDNSEKLINRLSTYPPTSLPQYACIYSTEIANKVEVTYYCGTHHLLYPGMSTEELLLCINSVLSKIVSWPSHKHAIATV